MFQLTVGLIGAGPMTSELQTDACPGVQYRPLVMRSLPKAKDPWKRENQAQN